MKTSARERFDSVVDRGVRPLGAFVMTNDASTSAIFASSGYDFVIIDREHGMIDLTAAVNHVRAVESGGAVPLIRVLEPTAGALQQALDAGAHGIVIPKAEDTTEIERLVSATRYEPGGRGKCPQTPGAGFLATEWEVRAAHHNQNVLLIPLLETMAGIESAGQIAAIEGIDYLFFGPADLSQDLGLDMYADRDKIREIFIGVQSAIRPTGARIGAPVGFGLDEEADFLTIGSDVGHIRTKAVEGLSRFRPANQ
ncbi:HpcH/HpaI aldolase family protein [Gordonia sp. KTR9]|uniref:HpcH/HpaI aldolase family protein n=1 Tax=Gordonia sp. KTR9 TaxID=337191 RepID=UPI00027DE69F|nr:aldolase/citrate lyase family protein [Gordonia sp. KTR9]AFR50935.1 2,4-dihydroxyhept-2-ene-1,7-dioic acid aldolase [Gordonia sp. KTR9]